MLSEGTRAAVKSEIWNPALHVIHADSYGNGYDTRQNSAPVRALRSAGILMLENPNLLLRSPDISLPSSIKIVIL